MSHPHSTITMDAAMRDCIANCTECHALCVATAAHCLEMGGEHASRAHQVTLLDCAQICATSADFMMRGSPIHGLTCGACAEACRRCADDCERLAMGDMQMLACAEACRRCQQSCEAMARRM